MTSTSSMMHSRCQSTTQIKPSIAKSSRPCSFSVHVWASATIHRCRELAWENFFRDKVEQSLSWSLLSAYNILEVLQTCVVTTNPTISLDCLWGLVPSLIRSQLRMNAKCCRLRIWLEILLGFTSVDFSLPFAVREPFDSSSSYDLLFFSPKSSCIYFILQA